MHKWKEFERRKKYTDEDICNDKQNKHESIFVSIFLWFGRKLLNEIISERARKNDTELAILSSASLTVKAHDRQRIQK